MRRREFIAGIAGVVAWPLRVGAQSSPIRRVGYIWIGARGTEVNAAGLSQGLVDLGYVIGRDVAIEDRYADGFAERIPALIAELLALKVDVLATPGTPLTRAAQRATSTVPIACVTVNPIGVGLVTSLSQPGGNITGLELVDSDYSEKSLQLLQTVAPKLRRIAVLRNNPLIAREIGRLHKEAQVLGVDLTVVSVMPVDLEGNLAAIANAGLWRTCCYDRLCTRTIGSKNYRVHCPASVARHLSP